ncbi:MarR family transcriptional regulator [Allobranchiibius sp. GilTou38]|uniref:MarR family winged helix-turn-helix transcriptional regulator n=1 Tax=Allobranchiibius sp. GilTou38 TaxID=2815210 RepID=UPI001AA13D59|nr:MarR family transcriptional regulator [Allobranchiibius sp. GilTou38]MBO1766651.1 MarR family transcriptional regulator [Allobranchiibius sp. GilTou38]
MTTITPAPDPALESMVCFDLYAASRAVTAVYRRLLSQYHLTYPQYLVLIVLWRTAQPTIGELAEAVRLDYGTLTPLLRRMERAGLVTRSRRSRDERIVTVSVTEAGAALQEQEPHIRAVITEATGLASEEMAALQQTLRTIAATSGRFQ